MPKTFEFPSKLERFIKRLVAVYQRNEMAPIAQVLSESKFTMKLETSYDNWNGGQYGHEVVILVPDHLMGLIPLDTQNDIQTRIVQDLNRASSSISHESIEDVHFEYADYDHVSDVVIDEKAITRLWQPRTLKLFISHRDTYKTQAHDLATRLGRYGISSFVAHDTIEPDEEWQKEIEQALQSMDAMLTFITDDFFSSPWTNQEIGFALAKGVPIVSLKLEKCDPIGFIKDRQAIRGDISDPSRFADLIYETLKKRLTHSALWRNLIISRFCGAISFEDAALASTELYGIDDLTQMEIERIVDAYNNNSQLNGCWQLNRGSTFFEFLNKYSNKKLKLLNQGLVADPQPLDDVVPF